MQNLHSTAPFLDILPQLPTQQHFQREQTQSTQKESKQTTQNEIWARYYVYLKAKFDLFLSAKAKATVLIGIVVSLFEDNMLLNQQKWASGRVFRKIEHTLQKQKNRKYKDFCSLLTFKFGQIRLK